MLYHCANSHHLLLLFFQIKWPDPWMHDHPDLHADDTPIFLISVDGVHCRIEEPSHPQLSKNPEFYSHKFRQVGVNYEIAVSVFTNSVVWVKGPVPVGKPDIDVFRNDGLKNMIPAGKRVIADKRYGGEKAIISTPNSHDPPELQKFKSHAQSCHESFNRWLKEFGCLEQHFRHFFENTSWCLKPLLSFASTS